MLTLILLRHAKSSWDHPGLDDFDRPLAERGLKAGAVMGAWLSSQALVPSLVICSTAARTRATLDLVVAELGAPVPEVVHDDGLYLASATELLARLRRVRGSPSPVMMVGHNPGFHDFALAMTGSASRDDRAALTAKFPTAGVAVLTIEATAWATVAPRSGHLAHFVTPSFLQKGRASQPPAR